MSEKPGMDIFLEYVPAFKIWYKALGTYLYQIILFLVVMFLFWWISSRFLIGSLLYQVVIAVLAILPFAYITKNSENLRKKYRERHGELAYQRLYYRFMIYTLPFGAASLYFPILLKTDYFLPVIISLPSHFVTKNLLPKEIAPFIVIPLGVFLIIVGALIRKPSGGFDFDIDSYVYLMFPEKSRKVEGGIYDYVRHPRYLGRVFLVMGLGVLANNILALGIAVIHFLSYFMLIKIEDGELVKRFGESFRQHQKEVPALIPKYGNWRKVVKFVFIRKG